MKKKFLLLLFSTYVFLISIFAVFTLVTNYKDMIFTNGIKTGESNFVNYVIENNKASPCTPIEILNNETSVKIVNLSCVASTDTTVN